MGNSVGINNNLLNCELVVVDLGYNLIVCGVVGINKIIYIHKFPPVLNTTLKPQYCEIKSHYEHKYNKNLRRETVLNFWKSKDLYQSNGDWKGGEWGSSNLPTTSKDFFHRYFHW